MNFLNLQYFCAAAEELSFTKAAAKLFISQQSLSNHISRLEDELGVVLFNRTQPVTLTEAGTCLYRHSKDILYKKQQTEKELQDIRDFRRGDLSIGVSTSRGSIILPQILPQFHHKFPQIKLRLVEGTTQLINQALYDGRTDLNIGFAINDPDNIHEELLTTETLVCAVPISYLSDRTIGPLPEPGSAQDLRTFATCPFIRMSPDSWLGGVFDHCCLDNGITPEIVLETASLSTLMSLCEAGMGAIVLPKVFAYNRMPFWFQHDWHSTIAVYPLKYAAGNRAITISRLRGHYLSRAAENFIHIAKETFCE